MEPLALPILAIALLFFILLGILIGTRNPPRFWMTARCPAAARSLAKAKSC